MLLSKDQILNQSDRAFELIEVPEWPVIEQDAEGNWVPVLDENGETVPGKVRVNTVSAAVAEQFAVEEARSTNENRIRNIRARFVIRCISDEDGNRIFDDADAEELGERSSLVIGRLFEVASRLNGLNVKDKDAEGN